MPRPAKPPRVITPPAPTPNERTPIAEQVEAQRTICHACHNPRGVEVCAACGTK